MARTGGQNGNSRYPKITTTQGVLVLVGVTGVRVDGMGVLVGGTRVLVGGTGVLVGGMGVLVGGTGVAVGGMGVQVSSKLIASKIFSSGPKI